MSSVKDHNITLLPAEDLLRRLVLSYRDAADTATTDPKLEMWFVGGWVRDKLLGVSSPDIDIALSTMTGTQFGEGLASYYAKHEAEWTKAANEAGVPTKVKISVTTAKRPEKSKHLETTIIKAFGLDVDVVNLREETYAEDSRNPEMQFTTPEIDAERRDITINALYYNLRTMQIQDFTGKGLRDMKDSIIRTPLEPYKTFIDDPLRVLRVIRFASRLAYTIDQEAMQMMSDERVHQALGQKISRERVGIEVNKMMNGPRPLMAFELIHELNLYETVFLNLSSTTGKLLKETPMMSPGTVPWPSIWPRSFTILKELLSPQNRLGSQLIEPENRGEVSWTLSAYAPLAALKPSINSDGENDSASNVLVQKNINHAVADATEALKLTHQKTKLLKDALVNMDNIQHIQQISGQPSASRGTVGMAIKFWGMTWKSQVLFVLLAETLAQADNAPVVARYSQFMDFVDTKRLHDAHLVKPVLNGSDVMRILKLKKSGSFMKPLMDELMRWQFDNETASKDEAVAWLLQHSEEFGVPENP